MLKSIIELLPTYIKKDYHNQASKSTISKPFVNHASCELEKLFGWKKQHVQDRLFAQSLKGKLPYTKFTKAYLKKAAKLFTNAEGLVLCELLAYAGTCDKYNSFQQRKNETIAAEIGCSVRTVQKAYSKIKKLGLFEIKQSNKYAVNVFICLLDKTRRGILYNELRDSRPHILRVKEPKKALKLSAFKIYREQVRAERLANPVIHNQLHTDIRKSLLYINPVLVFKENTPLTQPVNMVKKTLSSPITHNPHTPFYKKVGERETKLIIEEIITELAGCLGYDATMDDLRRQSRELMYRDLKGQKITDVMVEDVVKKVCALVSKKRGNANLDRTKQDKQSLSASYIKHTPKTNKFEPQANRKPIDLVLFCITNKIDLTPEIIDTYNKISDAAEQESYKQRIKFFAYMDSQIEKGLSQ